MQIIDELETPRRGPRAGVVGHIGFAGNMDTCIVLRALVITEVSDRQRQVCARVGAGFAAGPDL